METRQNFLRKIIQSFYIITFLLGCITGAIVGLLFKNWGIGVLTGVGLFVFSIASHFAILLPIKNFIKKYSTDIERIKDGDLTLLFNEERNKTNKMFEKLTHVFGDIILQFKEIVTQFFSVAQVIVDANKELDERVKDSLIAMEQIAKTGQEIAQGATEQAIESQNCEELMENLSDEIAVVYDNYQVIMDETTKMTKLSDIGAHSLNALKEKTVDTQHSTEEIAEVVEALTNQIKDITIFVESIESIATQTNLLALNAAIEAARAGDAGKGFGVVAEEIRKLADESKRSTEEIKNLVTSIQNQSTAAAKAMTVMNKVNEEENHAVRSTSKAFQDINASIKFISEKNIRTNSAIEKVNRHKEKVRAAMSHISAVAQTTAAQTQEVASTIENQEITMDKVKEATRSLDAVVSQIEKQLNKYRI